MLIILFLTASEDPSLENCLDENTLSPVNSMPHNQDVDAVPSTSFAQVLQISYYKLKHQIFGSLKKLTKAINNYLLCGPLMIYSVYRN